MYDSAELLFIRKPDENYPFMRTSGVFPMRLVDEWRSYYAMRLLTSFGAVAFRWQRPGVSLLLC